MDDTRYIVRRTLFLPIKSVGNDRRSHCLLVGLIYGIGCKVRWMYRQGGNVNLSPETVSIRKEWKWRLIDRVEERSYRNVGYVVLCG